MYFIYLSLFVEKNIQGRVVRRHYFQIRSKPLLVSQVLLFNYLLNFKGIFMIFD